MENFIIVVLIVIVVSVVGRLLALAQEALPMRRRALVAIDVFIGVCLIIWGLLVLI